MQCGARDGRTGHIHRFQDRHRRHTAGAAHLHDDVEQFGVHLLRRIFVGDRPPWRARCGAQTALQRQVVHLHHNAVEGVLDVVAVLLVILDHLDDLVEVRHLARMRRDGDAPPFIERIRLRLVVHLVGHVHRSAFAPLQFADAVRVEAQVPARGDARVLLAQRSGGRVARVGERRFAFVLVARVERPEVVPAHEHLAADLHEFGNVAFRSVQRGGNRLERAHVHRDVLARHAVAARQALHEHAVAVDEVERQAIDLDLARHRQRLALRPIQIAQHAVVPCAQLVV